MALSVILDADPAGEAGSAMAAIPAMRPPLAQEPGPQNAAFAYLPSLDGLRFVAFLLVFVHHSPPPQPTPVLSTVSTYGWAGVELFFAISGFLMLRLLIAEDASRGQINVIWFYLRRLLRIYPLMMFYSVISLLYYQRFGREALSELLSLTFAVYNYVTWFKGYATPIPYTAHLWTLSYELQIYLFIPIAFYVLKIYRARGLLIFLAGVEGSCLGARASFAWLGAPHPVIWATPFLRPESTLLGLAIGAGLIRLPIPAVYAAAIGAIAVLVNGPSVEQVGSWTIALYPICAIIGGALVYLVTRDNLFARALGCRWVAFLGKISFGLYVYHLAMLPLARRLIGANLPIASPGAAYAVQLAGGLLATVFAATVSYFVVERPFLQLKRRVTVVESRPV
jgi:peptidoglycan/LPS O-acetylase OafA/YrhL